MVFRGISITFMWIFFTKVPVMKKLQAIIVILLSVLYLQAQDYNYDIPDSVVSLMSKEATMYKSVSIVPLWPDELQNPKQVHAKKELCENQTEYQNEYGKDRWVKFVGYPNLYIFNASTGDGKVPAVIIYPGGGGKWISIDREGFNVARKLADNGITAIVVKYRTHLEENWDKNPPSESMWQTYRLVMSDTKEAYERVLSLAEALNIDKEKIGLMGFSAGCWWAMQLLYVNQWGGSESPAFGCLVYGGMSESIYKKSKNKKVPVFLVTSKDDPHIKFDDYMRFEKTVSEKANVGAYYLENSGHGFGISSSHPENNIWLDRFIDWMTKL